MKKVLFVASESVPFIKTGGLADVVGSLPKSFPKEEFDVRVVIPNYMCIPWHYRSDFKYITHFYMNLGDVNGSEYVGVLTTQYDGITFYFIDNQHYFNGSTPYGDTRFDIEKFCFFSKAVLSMLPSINFRPDIIHCHDWQTGVLPVYLHSIFRDNHFYDDDIKEIDFYKEKGIEFMFASGRDMNMMLDMIEKSHVDGDLIINNGTQYRNIEGTKNIVHPMDEDAFRKMIPILQKHNYHISIHTTKGKYILTDFESYWDLHVKLLMKGREGITLEDLPNTTFFRRWGYLNDCTSVSSIDEIYQQGALPLKVDARHLNPEEAKGVRERLDCIPHLNISSSYEDNIEITCDDYDKGIMLREVLKLKGLTLDEVATFGDGLNDVCMLKGFPYSFTPANGCKEAKEAATYTLTKTGGNGAIQEGLHILKDLDLI